MHRVPGRHHQHRHRWTAASAAAFLLMSTAGVALWSSVTPANAEPVAASTASPSSSPTGTVSPAPMPNAGPQAPAAADGTPDLAKGTAYLVAPERLIDGHYYTSFGGGFADFGLTIDGAFALAATGQNDTALKKIVSFLDQRGKDGSDRTIDDWTLIGTPYAGGGSIGKEALLAEVVGADPRAFGRQDLIAALDRAVCAKAGTDTGCPAAGAYTNSPSVFSQALGVMAQLRADDATNAAAPVTYLQSLQNADGAWPSLIPSAGDSDVDSTAMAVMALALAPGDTASQAVGKGIAWIRAQQQKDGGFPGTAGDSTNSAALAVQALGLDKATNSAAITKALAFLAGQQNGDGGFGVAAGGQPGSDVRASTQVVGGATGISFGTLSRDISGTPTPTTSPTGTGTGTGSATPTSPSTPTISTVPDSTGPSETGTAPVPPGAGGIGTGGSGQLAATGTDARQEGLLAATLLLAGAAALAAVRRRPTVGGRHR